MNGTSELEIVNGSELPTEENEGSVASEATRIELRRDPVYKDSVVAVHSLRRKERKQKSTVNEVGPKVDTPDKAPTPTYQAARLLAPHFFKYISRRR